jgi:hypothetical protein
MLIVLVVLVAVPAVLTAPAPADVTTQARDTRRTAWYPDQSALTPGLVSGGSFGKQWDTPVTGQVYAQPVVADGIVIIVTEDNWVYGLAEANGAVVWSKSLGAGWRTADVGCADLVPRVGITGTPVVDPATHTVYLLAKTYANGTSGAGRYTAHAFDVSTGAERSGFPLVIAGAATNDPSRTFSATNLLQRPGLLLLDGVVYAGFGGLCDHPPYSGWVVGFTPAGQMTTRFTLMAGTTASGAGVWQSGGGLVSDAPGEIVLTTGNGAAPDRPIPGNTPPGACGECVLRLRVQPDRSLRAVDFFAPYDAPDLDEWDADFGSGGTMALPPEYFGTPEHPRLVFESGKAGYVYLLDGTNLGGARQGPGGGDRVLARIGPYGGVWSTPAVWPGDGGWIYLPTASAPGSLASGGGRLMAYKYGLDGSGAPTLSRQGQSADAFGFGAGGPVVTSNGTQSGSALVWTIWSPNASGVGAQLRAYDPVPVNGILPLRWSAPIGQASKFASPAVDGMHVFVGTRDGHVMRFGSPVTTPLTGNPVNLPITTVGATATGSTTLTAAFDLTVQSVTVGPAPFSVGAPAPSTPVALTAGQSITVPVQLTPTQPGPVAGTITVRTSAGPVDIGVTGAGQSADPLLGATPTVVSFGGVAAGGAPVTQSITLTNYGAQPLTLGAIGAPPPPFSVTGAPSPGQTLAAGASITLGVTFAPTTTGQFTGSLTVASTGGAAQVEMSGTAGTPPAMTITPPTVDVGDTVLGTVATASFAVTNHGGSPLTITKSKPPVRDVGFTAQSELPEGSVIAPGATLTQRIEFQPTTAGRATDSWIITGDDGSGARTVTLRGNGVGSGLVPGPASGTWQQNGTAVLIGDRLELTPTSTRAVAGSAFSRTPVPSASLMVAFDATIADGNGADGMTVVFADPGRGATPAALGGAGAGLGFAGIPGVAVALDTFQGAGDPSGNFVGISSGPAGAGDGLAWVRTTTAVPALRPGTHRIVAQLTDGLLTVDVDGVPVLVDVPVTVPDHVLVGFTGANGWQTDRHTVSRVAITVRDRVPPPRPGYVLDGYGGLHPLPMGGRAPGVPHDGPYWYGWDIARDVVVLPDGTGGYVLDGWGGLHPFGIGANPAPPVPVDAPYWPGWDIARGVGVTADGTGGYVLDGWGGLHPFTVPGANHRRPARLNGPYWTGRDIARAVTLGPGGSGVLLDGWGGLHTVGSSVDVTVPGPADGPYWPGYDIARGLVGDRWGGVVVDGFGGLHPYGAPAAVWSGGPYWPGFPIARGGAG